MSANSLAGALLFELSGHHRRELTRAGHIQCRHCNLSDAFPRASCLELMLDLHARVDGVECARIELRRQCTRCGGLDQMFWFGDEKSILDKFSKLVDGARFDSMCAAQTPMTPSSLAVLLRKLREAAPHEPRAQQPAPEVVRPSRQDPLRAPISDDEARAAISRVRRARTWEELLATLGVRVRMRRKGK